MKITTQQLFWNLIRLGKAGLEILEKDMYSIIPLITTDESYDILHRMNNRTRAENYNNQISLLPNKTFSTVSLVWLGLDWV